MQTIHRAAILIGLLTVSLFPQLGLGDAATKAQRMYSRLTGRTIDIASAEFGQMVSHIEQGNLMQAARIATQNDDFINYAVKNFAAPMSNRNQSRTVTFNDFIATIMGIVRDDRNMQEALTGNYVYRIDPSTGVPSANSDFVDSNNHYSQAEIRRINYAPNLVVRTQIVTAENAPTVRPLPEAAGVLTSRQWAMEFIDAGTNRRFVEYLFKGFLCTSLDETRTAGLPDHWVRRDVDRAPGGRSATYVNTCVTCHAFMDALTGATARFEYNGGGLRYTPFWDPNNGQARQSPPGVARKFNQNGDVFPAGSFVTTDRWENMLDSPSHQRFFGWPSQTTGNGIQSLGAMVANSRRFAQCMSKRVFEEVCMRPAQTSEQSYIDELTDQFVNGNYKLRPVFEKAATYTICSGN